MLPYRLFLTLECPFWLPTAPIYTRRAIPAHFFLWLGPCAVRWIHRCAVEKILCCRVPHPSFSWVGVLTFVGTRTRGVIQNSKSLSNQDKIPAQAKPAWTGHPHLSSITGTLDWATRPFRAHRVTAWLQHCCSACCSMAVYSTGVDSPFGLPRVQIGGEVTLAAQRLFAKTLSRPPRHF